jgi:hypothetical protein
MNRAAVVALVFQTSSRGIDRLLGPTALVFVIVAILRRREEIGGWLLYFYYWIFAVCLIFSCDVILHYRAFLPLHGREAINHQALYLAVFPRLAALYAVLVVSLQLLRNRESVWVERLRAFLLVGVLVGGVSIWIDIRFFPKSAQANGARFAGLLLWFLYFHLSKRVQQVFYLKNWANPLLGNDRNRGSSNLVITK